MPHELTTSYLADVHAIFKQSKKLADGAMAQVSGEQLAQQVDEESNSIALIVKHMAGNMRSRWTDFLTTDGEKPDRDRDSEFIDPPESREALMRIWEDGWGRLFAALGPLSDVDLARTVTIRGEPHSVMQAINRSVGHYSYHVGQIVFLAKHLQGANWRSLSIPRNQSAQVNQRFAAKSAKG